MPVKPRNHRPNNSRPGEKTLAEKARANGRALALTNAAWRRLRAYKLNADPLCSDCQKQGRIVSATEVDHIDNNPSNNALDNLDSLCKPCHSRKTNRDMGNRPVYGCDVNGIPLDPDHHWNRSKKSPAAERP